MTLRVRLTVALVALVAAGLVVSDVATYTALRSYLVKRVDQQLLSSSRQVLFALSSPETPGPGPGPGDGDPILPSGTFGVILDASGSQVGQPVVFNYGGDVLPPPVLPATIHRGTLREHHCSPSARAVMVRSTALPHWASPTARRWSSPSRSPS